MAEAQKQRSLLNALARWSGLSSSKALAPMPQDGSGGGMSGFGDWNTEPLSTQFLLGSGRRQARDRLAIYGKWQLMLGDPIISSALRLHVTGALGGHETKGDMVFIEAATDAPKASKKLVDELRNELQPIFNRIAATVAFNGIGFGDAYGRIYSSPRVGVRDVYVDELMYPPLIQAYERGSTTIGYLASTGTRYTERLNVAQVARMKLPRMVYLPQQRVVEKAMRTALSEDDPEKLPALPSLVGGSFLDAAEEPYDALSAALVGLVGQRILDGIDESMIGVNLADMTKEQRGKFLGSVQRMFKRSHDYARQVATEGRPVFGRIRHILPVFNDKQVVEIRGAAGGASGGGMSRATTIEDVMMHARLLSGALGIDLSMLGFADQMTGGLGDGGFFRVSAHAAERARMIRVALVDFFEQIIRVHLFMKYGTTYDAVSKPWDIKFWSGIAALERERQETFTTAQNTVALMTQTLTGLRDLGLEKDITTLILKNYGGVDEVDAVKIAAALEKAKPADDGMGGPGGVDAPEPGALGEFATDDKGAK